VSGIWALTGQSSSSGGAWPGDRDPKVSSPFGRIDGARLIGVRRPLHLANYPELVSGQDDRYATTGAARFPTTFGQSWIGLASLHGPGFSSPQRRIRTLQAASESSVDAESAEPDISPAPTQPFELYFFVAAVREGMPEGLPFHLADYLDLVYWTGRAVRADKRGGPSLRICRRSWSTSASPKRHGWSWPRTSRPTSASGSVKPSVQSGPASAVVSAGREASASAGGCFPAEHSQRSP